MIKFFKAIYQKIAFSHLSDEELVRRYLSTSKNKYFDLLYRRHNAKVYAKCLTMLNNETMCKDALQDIFLKVLVNISAFNFKSKFSTWVFSITYNHCIDVIRKEGKFQKNLPEDSIRLKSIPDDDNAQEKQLLEIKVEQLETVLENIPVKDKTLLILKYQGGMSIKEISHIIGKSESAVKMALKRAKLKSLRRYNELFNM